LNNVTDFEFLSHHVPPQNFIARTILYDPPQLARLVVGGLPKLRAELVILCCIGTYQDKRWLIDRLGVDGIELRPGLTDEDKLASDFNAQISHGSLIIEPRIRKPRCVGVRRLFA
jgi:hypothetical protein